MYTLDVPYEKVHTWWRINYTTVRDDKPMINETLMDVIMRLTKVSILSSVESDHSERMLYRELSQAVALLIGVQREYGISDKVNWLTGKEVEILQVIYRVAGVHEANHAYLIGEALNFLYGFAIKRKVDIEAGIRELIKK